MAKYNSEARYRSAPNFYSTSSSLALRRARFHIDRENRCQSPSRCCRILADCRCCSCKRDRRGTRSALSLSGPSSAQPVGTFGAAVPGNRPLEVGNQTDRQRPQVKTAFMQINSGNQANSPRMAIAKESLIVCWRQGQPVFRVLRLHMGNS